jgi:hypothetical protein
VEAHPGQLGANSAPSTFCLALLGTVTESSSEWVSKLTYFKKTFHNCHTFPFLSEESHRFFPNVPQMSIDALKRKDNWEHTFVCRACSVCVILARRRKAGPNQLQYGYYITKRSWQCYGLLPRIYLSLQRRGPPGPRHGWFSRKRLAPRSVQLVHGISEYIGRYSPFARFLTDHGFAVVGH